MDGLFVQSAGMQQIGGMSQGLTLLAQREHMEIMLQPIKKDAVIWLSPGEKEDDYEFYFVHSGKLEFVDLDGTEEYLYPGDSFLVQGLKESIMLHCLEQAELLCFSSAPVFRGSDDLQENLRRLLDQIDAKDHYTKQHSKAVMHYAIRLYEELKDQCPGLSLDDYVVGCLFHDVGKCRIPDEIISKPSQLTPKEYQIMKQHPIESYRILEPVFGERVAKLARYHHERMDGSGYPSGLKGKEIPFEARILMVADALDAMTSKRVYSNPRSLLDAARELYSLPQHYDRSVTSVLLRMVEEETFCRYNPDSI